MTTFSANNANEESDSLDAVKLKQRQAKLQAEMRGIRADNLNLHKQLDHLTERLDGYAAISDHSDDYLIKSIKPAKSEKAEATAVVCFSDWHVGERVVKNKTNGLNAYSPVIAKTRAESVARNTVTLIEQNSKFVDITSTVIWLGGDFITGHLHPELAETNVMGPVEEAYFAYELLASAIKTIAECKAAGDVTVVCTRGNHARTTKKMQYKNDDSTSFESFIYWTLRDKFPDIDFVVNSSDITYLRLSRRYTIRFIHGHQVRYGGGVGGISIPLKKWIHKQQDTRHADYTVLGHFHQRQQGADYLINGSTKGYDEFAQSHGFSYEPPQQSFFLVDHLHNMVTTSNPIFS